MTHHAEQLWQEKSDVKQQDMRTIVTPEFHPLDMASDSDVETEDLSDSSQLLDHSSGGQDLLAESGVHKPSTLVRKRDIKVPVRSSLNRINHFQSTAMQFLGMDDSAEASHFYSFLKKQGGIQEIHDWTELESVRNLLGQDGEAMTLEQAREVVARVEVRLELA